jgi:hypothetical protein
MDLVKEIGQILWPGATVRPGKGTLDRRMETAEEHVYSAWQEPKKHRRRR